MGQIPRQRRNCVKIVEPSDEHGTDNTGRPLGSEQRSQMCARVLSEQHELIGIDAEVTRAATNEKKRGAEIGERILVARKAAKTIVHGKPVIAAACEHFEDLSDMSDAASGRPSPAVDHDDGGAWGRAWLDVRVERKIA